MDIIINGTKKGWRNNPPFYVSANVNNALVSDIESQDMRMDGNTAIGSSAYSVLTTSSGYGLCKYLIVSDKLRGARGYVVFWIHLPAKEKISGKDAVELLDSLCGKYCAVYITSDYSLEGTIKEDWAFVDYITAEYKIKISTFSEHLEFNRGTELPAFVYYKDEAELEKYFDDPYNEAYSKFSQVLFIDALYKDRTDSPLLALKHQEKDLTGLIETGNPQFLLSYLETTKDGVKIDVLVNGSRPYGKSMRKRDILKIDYSKLYHESKSITGNLSSIQDYVGVNDAAKIVTIKEVSLIKKERIIKINITDLKGKTIKGADVRVRRGNNEKIVTDNNEVKFAGDEIGLRWTVAVIKADMKTEKEFSPAETDFVEIKLNRQKKVAVIFQDAADKSTIRNCSLKKGGYRVDCDELEFIDDEIDSFQTFSVSHPNYQSDTFRFRPSEVAEGTFVQLLEMVVKLKDGPYRLKIDPRRGSKLRSGDTLPHQIFVDPRGNRNYDCKARFGYVFDGWDGPIKRAAEMSFEARFTERWWHKKGFVVTLFAIAVITAGVLSFMGRESDQRKTNEKDEPYTAPRPPRTKTAATPVAPPSTTDSSQNNDSDNSVTTGSEMHEEPAAATEKVTETKEKLITEKKLKKEKGAKSTNLEDRYWVLFGDPNASYQEFSKLCHEFQAQEGGDERKLNVLKKITKNKVKFDELWGSIPKEHRILNSKDQGKIEALIKEKEKENETTN
jgi:hypothetical protein